MIKPSALLWRILSVSAATVGFLLAPACNTTDTTPTKSADSIPRPQARRISELKSDYEKLPTSIQAKVAKGSIGRGQSPEIVYIALGRPNSVITSADGRVTVWIYQNYYPPVAEDAVENPARKAPVKPKYASQMSNPLQDSMQAWSHNVDKNYVPMNSDPQFMNKAGQTNPRFYNPEINRVPRAPGQSWADYARYVKNQEMASSADGSGFNIEAKMVDSRARAEYDDLIRESPIKDPDPVKLTVIFTASAVSDAIINDSVSAFTFQP